MPDSTVASAVDVARPAIVRPTLDSVAERAGVSRQTVSNVLNSPHMVRSDTADRVKLAISELGYRPHLAAKQLRTRRSRVLGLRVAKVGTDAVFDRFLHAITEAASARDYRIMLYTAVDDDAEIAAYDELLGRWDIDGFILTATHPGDLRTSYLSDRNVPCVSFGRPWGESAAHPWVDVDGGAGTAAATEYLIAAGHTDIGFLGWPTGSAVGDDRHSGWARTLRAAGLKVPEPGRSTNDLTEARAAAAVLLDQHAPSALICASDVLAIGALAELAARGLRPGHDIAVVGFDNSELANVTGLTSVDQRLEAVASECARLLIDLVEPGPDAGAPEHVLLTPELVARSSTGHFRPSPVIPHPQGENQ